MKMKFMNHMIADAAIILAVVGFTGCGDTPAPEELVTDVSLLPGIWMTVDGRGTMSQLSFESSAGAHNVVLTEFEDYRETFSAVGNWLYMADSNMLRVSLSEEEDTEIRVMSYQIDGLTSNGMTLKNQMTGQKISFVRVKETYTVPEGESVRLNLFDSWRLEVPESPVMRVDGDMVYGEQYGTDVATVRYKDQQWYMRFVVMPEISVYIDAMDLTPEEVKRKFGTPSGYGTGVTGRPMMRYHKPTPSVQDADFIYDSQKNMMEGVILHTTGVTGYDRLGSYVWNTYTRDPEDDNIYWNDSDYWNTTVEVGFFLIARDITISNLRYYYQ